jgi:hypothetical protein
MAQIHRKVRIVPSYQQLARIDTLRRENARCAK